MPPSQKRARDILWLILLGIFIESSFFFDGLSFDEPRGSGWWASWKGGTLAAPGVSFHQKEGRASRSTLADIKGRQLTSLAQMRPTLLVASGFSSPPPCVHPPDLCGLCILTLT